MLFLFTFSKMWTEQPDSLTITFMNNPRYFFYIFVLALPFVGVSCSNKTIATIGKAKNESLPTFDWEMHEDISRRPYNSLVDDRIYKFIAYKFDPDVYHLAIHHEQPKRLEDWQAELRSPLVLNGAYFTEDMSPTGQLVIDGVEIGSNIYDSETTGTLYSNDNVTTIIDSLSSYYPEVRANTDFVQSFPLLIMGGKVAINEDSEKIARRTVIAQDYQDNILVLIVDQTPVSLYKFSNILKASDLNIKTALNLDGGPSTGLIMTTDSFSETIYPVTELPQVISLSKYPQD
jgi:uncharacterized protein YigE (DUF2233 family)